MILLAAFGSWIFLFFGMTYLVSRAEIFEHPRVYIVAYIPVLAQLLACRACASFWTGQAATAAVMGVAAGFGTVPPWYSWLYLPPVGGIAAVGLIDLIAFARGGSQNG